MPSVQLGRDIQTGETVEIGDIERRSGLYILGKPGMGKSALMVNMAIEDLGNGHKIFFLDPHGDAISDFVKRFSKQRKFYPYLYDPADREYAFGINLLSCTDITDLTAVTDTYTRAYNVFYKLWEDSWGPWLQLILQNTLWAFIENQEYTLAEVPLFLNTRNTKFRDYILSNVKLNQACVDFWQYEFFERRERDQQERVEAALTRINTLLTHPYVRHIIGQKTTTTWLPAMLSDDAQHIILFKLSANLPEDIKKFIGTILFSELLHAVRNRPEDKRDQFCIFIDEFQNFATSDDIRTFITDGRKFGSAITYAHQERFGQFADNQRLMGATLAAANKVIFQSTVKDSAEIAPEFAQAPTTTETRLEAELIISQNPVENLLKGGHKNVKIQNFANKYLRYYPQARDEYLHEIEDHRLVRADLLDDSAFFRGEERMESLGGGRYADQRINLALQRNALSNAENSLKGAGEHIEKMRISHRILEKLREEVIAWNEFLVRVMQGMIPGTEAYSTYINTRLKNYVFFHNEKEPLFVLYVSLVYGDPNVPRAIPLQFALEHGFFHDDATKIVAYHKYTRNLDRGKNMESYVKNKTGQEREDYLKWLGEWWIERLTEQEERYISEIIGKVNFDIFSRKYITLPDHLEPHVLSKTEREEIARACLADISEKSQYSADEMQKVLNAISEVCILLSQPENHIKIPSGQYVEKQVHVRPVHDMTDEMAQELSNLPRFTAYAKIIEEKDGEQKVKTRKIQTYMLPDVHETAENDMKAAINNGHLNSKKRSEIEEKIRKRQEKWRVVAPQAPSEPPQTSEPPPTSD